MLCLLQQQMCQWEDDKAAREQQLLMACMERELSERAREDQEECRDCRHQDFMMMTMIPIMARVGISSKVLQKVLCMFPGDTNFR
eukprot:13579558-Ditylum_brightwellii.AAC.1